MSITRDQTPWDCVSNHLPDWIEDNDAKFFALFSKEDKERLTQLINLYNDLSEAENSNEEDAFSLYGIEFEKDEIIKEIVKNYEKYRTCE